MIIYFLRLLKTACCCVWYRLGLFSYCYELLCGISVRETVAYTILLGGFVLSLFFPLKCPFPLLVTLYYCFLSFPYVKTTFVKLHPGHRVACVAFVVHSLFQTCAVGGNPSPSPNLKSTLREGVRPRHQTRHRYTGEEKAKRATEWHYVITL